MEKEMPKSKKELMEMLTNGMNYYLYEERNPFVEGRMYHYIGEGMKRLQELNVSDETLVKMYDKDDVLYFEVEG